MKLLETIRFENGKFENLDFHQKRMNHSRKMLFGQIDEIDLPAMLQSWMNERAGRSSGFEIWTQKDADLQSAGNEIKNSFTPDFQITNPKELSGLFKCRIIYSEQIEKVEFIPYSIPKINKLKMVFDDQISYTYKFLNRTSIEKLYNLKGNHDDVLIVKNGLITDTSYANIIFYNGTEWLTPEKPLLKGTQRVALLEKEMIKTADIRPVDLIHFKKARLLNAMIRFEDKMDIMIRNIISV